MGQGAAEPGVPVLAVVQRGDAVEAALLLEIHPEEPGAGVGELRVVAAAHVRVPHGDLAGHHVQQVVEVGAVLHVGEPGRVPVPHVAPGGAVGVVHVEEVAHEAPSVAEHLGVLGPGLHADAEAVEGQPPVPVGGRAAGGVHHAPGGAGADEELGAVVGGLDRAHALHELGGLPVLQAVAVQGGAGLVGHVLQDEDVALGPGGEPDVVARRQVRRRHDPVHDPLGIELDLVVVALLLTLVVVLFVVARIRALLVAPGGEGRHLVVLQDRHVERAGDGPVVRRHVQPPGVQPVVGGGQEVEVVPVHVPDGIDGVGHPVGELVRLARLGVVDEDGAELGVQPPRVGDPP